jgi:hypothetical protein
VIGRRPIPSLGETAKSARERGCLVPIGWLPDDAIVTKVEDWYPEVYAWTIHWSTGITTGVRRPDEP